MTTVYNIDKFEWEPKRRLLEGQGYILGMDIVGLRYGFKLAVRGKYDIVTFIAVHMKYDNDRIMWYWDFQAVPGSPDHTKDITLRIYQ